MTADAPRQTGAISGFWKFSKEMLEKGSAVHSYSICGGGRLGPKWRRFNSGEAAWACHSLKEAFEKYFWNGCNYESNKKELDGLKICLTESIKARDDRFSARVIRDIFKWGGNHNPNDENHRWTVRRAHRGTLCRAIDEGVRLLKDSTVSASLDRFNGCDLRMNSSFAKVYALADRDGSLIIYDGRVGAALGHLARLYLEQRSEANVPLELAFRWGGTRTVNLRDRRDGRNPSTSMYTFPRLFGGLELPP